MPKKSTQGSHIDEFASSGTSPTISPRVLTIPQASVYLSASNWFVEELLRSGEVQSFIQGKKRVVDVRELDKYVDRRNQEPFAKLEWRTENFGNAV